jgi:nucleoside-diphosphate-sugar epimerase
MESLVTGAAGFVGSHLCEYLLDRGDEMRGVDAFTRTSWGTDFSTYLEHNVLATERLLEACRLLHPKVKLVSPSRSSIDGDVRSHPIPESTTPAPFSRSLASTVHVSDPKWPLRDW